MSVLFNKMLLTRSSSDLNSNTAFRIAQDKLNDPQGCQNINYTFMKYGEAYL